MSEPIHFNLLMNVIDVSTKLIYFGRELSQVEVKPNVPLIINLGVVIISSIIMNRLVEKH